jgi:DNA-binding CsgD family transcriptional regulator
MPSGSVEPERRVRRMSGRDGVVAAQWFRAQHPVLEPLSIALPDLLASLIDSRVMTAACVEQRSSPQESWTLDGFGLSAFFTDDAVARYYDDPPAFLDMELLDRCRMGETARCFLSAEEIARANAGDGLSLFGLSWLQSTYDFQQPSGRKLLEMSFQIMIGFHRGYQLQRAMHTGWAEYAMAMHAVGFADYKQPVAEPGSPYLSHPNQHARIYGRHTAMDAKQALPGSPISYLFSNDRPVFGLTVAEQSVIECALADLPDASIAAALGISVTAVQQRWKRIYQRAAATRPALIVDGDPRDDAVRGNEKRRQVLNYVRNHPEELRPYDTKSAL